MIVVWVGAIVVALALLVGMVIAGAVAAHRKEQAAIEALFAGAGFVLVRKPSAEVRAAVWPVFAPFGHLKHGAKGIQWIARGQLEGREVVVIRHQYTVSTGQSAQQIVHHCVACRAPEWWPMVELRGQHMLHRLADALGAGDIELESEAFNRRWRVSAESEDQAILVLTPEAQAMLAEAPPGEAWAIGRGWVRMSARKMNKAEQLRVGLGRPARLLAAAPPELLVEGNAP